MNWDFSTIKNFAIRERRSLEFRFEAFNLPNHPNWGFPNAIFTSSSFGKITSTSTDMRELQFTAARGLLLSGFQRASCAGSTDLAKQAGPFPSPIRGKRRDAARGRC